MSTVEELRDSAYTLERGNWPLAAERMRKAAAELDALKHEVERLKADIKQAVDEHACGLMAIMELKHDKERLDFLNRPMRPEDWLAFCGEPDIRKAIDAAALAKEKV